MGRRPDGGLRGAPGLVHRQSEKLARRLIVSALRVFVYRFASGLWVSRKR